MKPPPEEGSTKPTRQEQARAYRRAAYQRQKEQRAKDPKVIAMKELARQRRRELYQEIKRRKKGAQEKTKLPTAPAVETPATDSPERGRPALRLVRSEP
jgi:hypothetical protein